MPTFKQSLSTSKWGPMQGAESLAPLATPASRMHRQAASTTLASLDPKKDRSTSDVLLHHYVAALSASAGIL